MTIDNTDVLIVGAGISGIGAAYHLQKNSPHQTFAIVEARKSLGGTWDLFRYPGVRSDSDMYTFGFKFKPWASKKSISSGKFIRRYLNDAANESDITRHIQFSSRVIEAQWSSQSARWTVLIQDTDTGHIRTLICRFFFSCGGYFNYEQGYTPAFKRMSAYKGPVIHPQAWPENAKWKGKHVTVIGSGATAITLVPALAKEAAHVTVVQRSATFIVSRPEVDRVAQFMQRLLPAKLAYSVVRWRNILGGIVAFSVSRRFPNLVKHTLFKNVAKEIHVNDETSQTGMQRADLEKHFLPHYKPWDQRICLIPDGDLFDAINNGSVSIKTDNIDQFTPDGIALKSGEHIDTDLIVTATGLNIDVFSGIQFVVDGHEIDPSRSYCYKGMMLSGVPNMAFSIGYTNASWTLKSDLVGEYVCRLLNHMRNKSYDICTPVEPPEGLTDLPLMDFTSSYVKRGQSQMPRQGSRRPWRLYQNYVLDRLVLAYGSVEDNDMVFSRIKPLTESG